MRAGAFRADAAGVALAVVVFRAGVAAARVVLVAALRAGALVAVLVAVALVAVRLSLRDVRARRLVAPRLTAAAFFDTLEALFLRVFCDTACARNCHAPV